MFTQINIDLRCRYRRCYHTAVDKKNDKVKVSCQDCGSVFEVSYDHARHCKADHHWRCKPCMSKYKSALMQESSNNIGKIISEKMKDPVESKRYREMLAARAMKAWDNKSEEDKKEWLEKFKSGNKAYHDNMSDSEKDRLVSNLRRYYKTRSSDESKRHRSLLSKSHKRSSQNNDKRNKIVSNNRFTHKSQMQLIEKFEAAFNSSILSKEYYLIPEVVAEHNGIKHHWDYGIYSKSSNSLAVLVDIDGAYFHADTCDYDGLHSHEEYDERRSLSVPIDTKYFIINETGFYDSFKELMKIVPYDYNEYMRYIFKWCREIQFPFPSYSDRDMMRSYRRMCMIDPLYGGSVSINTRLGDRIIQNFHHSIYYAHRKGKPSPYEAWNNDELLRKCIDNRLVYQSKINPNKILQGFNVSKIAPKVSVFSAGRARMLIAKYLNDFNTIFDPFSGFSGRMLGAISLNKRYIGQDISNIAVNESNQILSFLESYGVGFDATVTVADVNNSHGEYPCLFTCPPYGDIEQWFEVPPSVNSCDSWIEICLRNFKCRKYVFVVNNTERYKNNIVEVIHNKSHMNLNDEYIICIEGASEN